MIKAYVRRYLHDIQRPNTCTRSLALVEGHFRKCRIGVVDDDQGATHVAEGGFERGPALLVRNSEQLAVERCLVDRLALLLKKGRQRRKRSSARSGSICVCIREHRCSHESLIIFAQVIFLLSTHTCASRRSCRLRFPPSEK